MTEAISYEIGFAAIGCYIVRHIPGEGPETVRVGIKSYHAARKMAEAMEREDNAHNP